jgi:hypothetical protein
VNYREILLAKYEPYPGEPARVLDGICRALMEQMDEVPWANFTGDDWQLLTLMARTEGVAPLMYDAFKRAGPERVGVPADSFRELKEEYYQTAAYNALLFEELEKILGALEEAGIPVVLLKGAALAQTVYPDPALRPMSDLDLLVHEGDLDRCEEIVHELGYNKEPNLGGADLHKLVNYEINYDGETHFPAKVEFHWDLIAGKGHRRYRPQIGWFWECKSVVNDQLLGGIGGYILTPAAHWLYLTGHLKYKHLGRERLLWYYDLYLLLQQHGEQINWDLLLESSGQFNWKFFFLAAVHDLQSIFGAQFRGEIAERVASSKFIQDLESVKRPTSNRVINVIDSLVELTWLARFRLIMALIFPTTFYISFRYRVEKRWKIPFFYFYRWGDMIVEGLRYLWPK